MALASLTPEQEFEAKELEAKIRLAIEKEVGALAHRPFQRGRWRLAL